MLGQKNKTHIVVVKDTAPLIETATRADLTAGQIAVFKNGSATAIDGTTDLTSGDQFKVVFKDVEGNIIESPTYKYDNILTKTAANYSAATEQKTYIGYNGTTGSIAVANSDIYTVRLLRKDYSKTWGEHGSFKLVGTYQSDASATQTEIADALVANMYKNLLVEKQKSGTWVTKVGRINSAAVTAANDFTGDTTVVQGTNFITIAESGNNNDAAVYGAGNTDLAVGDYVRIGGVGAGTALTSNVYKVTALSGAKTSSIIATLDVEVIEASGTYAAATHDIEVIPAATAAAANWGLMLQSQSVKFSPGLFKNQNVTFNVMLNDAFGSTIVTNATNASKGVGTYREVAEMEWELRNNQREAYHVASYPITETLNAISGKTYDMIVVNFKDDNARSINGYDLSFHSLVIASEDESAATVHTDLKDILNIT